MKNVYSHTHILFFIKTFKKMQFEEIEHSAVLWVYLKLASMTNTIVTILARKLDKKSYIIS